MNSLVQELKLLIERYLEENRYQSLHSLGKRCGVATSTLRRIVKLELRQEPSDHTIYKLVSFLSKETNIAQLKKKFANNTTLLQALERNSYALFRDDEKSIELEHFFYDRYCYLVYKLAANHSGVTEEKIQRLFGVAGTRAAAELCDAGAIECMNGRYQTRQGCEFRVPKEILVNHIPELLRFALSSEKKVPGKVFANLSESVNKETYIKICEIVGGASREISALVKKEESKGDIPFFYTGVVDTIDL